MNTTTRTFPRTSGEAFKGAAYGAAIERPSERRANAALKFTYVLAIWILLCAVFLWGQP